MNEINYYLAPMEGITGFVFRNAYHQVFEDFDEYITPFISPAADCIITPKELRDVHPDNNQGMNVVPQILANRADYFIETAKYLEQLGYKELNLNLGCPSGTVTAKKKGSGAFRDLELVRELLEGIYSGSPLPVSIKTRVGFEGPEEFCKILEIYKDYPMTKLIIHPRTRKDFYKGDLHPECVSQALEYLTCPIVFNGDLWDSEFCRERLETYPGLEGLMFGRPAVGNPFLLEECRKGQLTEDADFRKRLAEFLNLLLEGYFKIMREENNAMHRMKEVWTYMGNLFDDADKPLKGIRKAKSVAEYKLYSAEIVRNGSRAATGTAWSINANA